MNKKYIILLTTLLLAIVVGIATVALVDQANAKEYFPESGYILGSDDEKKVSFTKETEFNASQLGTVSFKNLEGDTAVLEADSFVHMEDGSVMALDDGILLDFSDLSSNFINNYYITRTLSITETGSGYTAETDSGSLTFGEYLWKLSDNKYMICSSTLNVYFSDDDIREVSNFVEISVTDDGIVEILTDENTWMTISDQCYIETANGVRINPLTHVIDDGTYQITTSKLVVSADDSIVLTEDETRRQIVPELNIEVVDGEDGEDGVIGESGTSGEDGILGEDGEDGEDGASGDDGASGEDGASGASGASGSSGVNGANGTKGVDATHESSINTALPTMTITDWNVTSTSLQATIGVGGGTETLEVTGTTLNDYNGWITITNVATGEIVYCYQTDGDYYTDTIADTDNEISDFKNAVDVYFTTFDGINSIDVLTPDTEYILSVNAYYVINEVIYSREFISRTFYTDSTGIQVSAQSSTTSTATVDVYSSTTSTVDLYILTEAQNASFSLAAASDYTPQTVNIGENDTETVKFTGLSADTKYIVRAVVTVDGSTTLTSQEEEIYTLKNTPTWDEADIPTAYYNRVTGMFEVYRPTVTDSNDGVSYYVYTVYDSEGTAVTSKTVYPSDGEPVSFYLSSGIDYSFGVEMYFYDNEKTTVYDLGESGYIKSEGSSLPKVTWTELLDEDYDSLTGTIRITLDGDSTINISESNPLTIEVYADQVINITEQLFSSSDSAGVLDEDYYSFSYDPYSETSNYIDINVDLINLFEDTNYTFTVSGYIDLGDGNGPVNRTLGYVSAYTYEVNSLRATFEDADTSNAISKTLSLAVATSAGEESDSNYVTNELLKGNVTVELYQGTGNTKTFLGSTSYSAGSDEISDIYYGEGVTITETSFGLPNLDTESNYTLSISEVVDDTYNMGLGYQNEFDTISNSSVVVTANATPPDLLADPTGGIDAIPIYNIDATTYGAKYDETMPDDAIIGYSINSTYDNSQRLASTITYYAFEYAEFYNALTTGGEEGNDPLLDEEAEKLGTFTLDTPNTSDDLPKIALFFNDVEFTNTLNEGTTYSNGHYIYQLSASDTENVNGSNYTRGYRFIFAYTVEYAANTTDTTTTYRTYPYDHSEYDDYMSVKGCGTEMGTSIGVGTAYILNSGMVSAPKTTPEFSTYVYETNQSSATQGTVTLHYKYSDSDDAIVDTDETENTKIKYLNTAGTEEYQTIVEVSATDEGESVKGWYSISLPYELSGIEQIKILAPEVEISDYIQNYDDILDALTDGSYVAEPCYLAQIPVDYGYGFMLSQDSYIGQVKIEMDLDNVDENYITFNLSNVQTGSTAALDYLAERAYVMQLDFTFENDDTETFYVPITTTTTAGTTYYSAIFSTSQISEYIGKEFTVDASLWFDDGTQGWSLLTEGMFGLQRINETGTENFGLEAQYAATTGSLSLSYSKTGGLLRNSYEGDLLEAMRDTAFGETLITTNFYAMTNSNAIQRYLTIEHYGVSDTTYNNVDYISENYIVPKGANKYDLTFSSIEDSKGTVDSITPTVGSISTSTGATQLTMHSFVVSGYSEIYEESENGYKEVELYIYEDEEMTTQIGDVVVVELDGNGKFDLEDSIRLPGGTDDDTDIQLTANTVYYLVFKAVVGDAESNALTVLLDTTTAELAIYDFETIDGIKITPSDDGIYYNNFSYMSKSLELTYTLNNYQGVSVTYDIFESSNITTTNGSYSVIDDSNIYFAHDDLVEASILTEKTITTINTIIFNLEPAAAREKLVPGTTYYLRIYGTTGEGGSEYTVILPFTITSIGNISAIITADIVTSNSITYYVSIVDPQYSLITEPNKDYSYYAVRFTDEDGTRILTVYDNQVFNASTTKQKFELNNDTLTIENGTLSSDTTYYMYVYAVIDATHNGTSYPVASEDDQGEKLDDARVQNYSYFSGDDDDDDGSWSGLNTLVSSFWENTENITTMDIVEANFAIGSKIQMTTNEENLYVNTDGASIKLNASSKMELTLQESYGIVTTNEYDDPEQTFKKIEYSIEGYDSTGTPIYIWGEIYDSLGDQLFTESTNSNGFNIFTFEIPNLVATGDYTVTIKLYKNENDIDEYETISRVVN